MPRKESFQFTETPKPQVTPREQADIIRSGQIFEASKARARRAMEGESRKAATRRGTASGNSRNYQTEDWTVKFDRNVLDQKQMRTIRAKIKKTGAIEPKKEPQPIDFAEKPDRNDPGLVAQGRLKKHWNRLLGFFKKHTVDNSE